MISIIVAIADNGVIGSSGEMLPWKQAADLKHFRETTMGHPIIMGRRTYETINRSLPGRTNIIITHDPDFNAQGCIVTHSLDGAIKAAGDAAEIFITGGANIYQQALAITDKIYLTLVHGSPEGDIHFTFDESQWKQVKIVQKPADAENQFDYDFIELIKQK